jgi:hypothetical protein
LGWTAEQSKQKQFSFKLSVHAPNSWGAAGWCGAVTIAATATATDTATLLRLFHPFSTSARNSTPLLRARPLCSGPRPLPCLPRFSLFGTCSLTHTLTTHARTHSSTRPRPLAHIRLSTPLDDILPASTYQLPTLLITPRPSPNRRPSAPPTSHPTSSQLPILSSFTACPSPRERRRRFRAHRPFKKRLELESQISTFSGDSPLVLRTLLESDSQPAFLRLGLCFFPQSLSKFTDTIHQSTLRELICSPTAGAGHFPTVFFIAIVLSPSGGPLRCFLEIGRHG